MAQPSLAETSQAQTAVFQQLQVIPLEAVLLHEHSELLRSQTLAEAMLREQVIHHPVIIAPLRGETNRFMLLDGLQRLNSLKALGARHLVAQVVNPSECLIRSWSHRWLSGPLDIPFDELEYITLYPEREDRLLATLQQPQGDCRLYARAQHSQGLVFAYWELFDLYQSLPYERCSPRSKAGPDEYLVDYEPLPYSVLSELVRQHWMLPSGLTRFVVPNRVLNLNVPLRILFEKDPPGQFRLWLSQRLHIGAAHTYDERVLLFES